MLGVAIPMVIHFFGMAQFFGIMQEFEMMEQTGDVSMKAVLDSMVSFFSFFILVMGLVSVVFIGWLWSIGIGLQEKMPKELVMNTSLFKAALILPAVYFIGLFGFMWTLFSNIDRFLMETIDFSFFSIIFPIHILSMIAMVYSLYFAAKTIKTAEVQQEVSFGDFIGEFFMIWFFPIGVWMLQPKINEIYLHKEENHDVEF